MDDAISAQCGVRRADRRGGGGGGARSGKAALGYEDSGSFVADPLRRGPRIWFDEIREPRRGRPSRRRRQRARLVRTEAGGLVVALPGGSIAEIPPLA